MNSPIVQLLVLAAIAIFLILRLRSVLGSREGFEKPPVPLPADAARRRARPELEVIEGRPDRDITDHVAEDSDAARALSGMKADLGDRKEPCLDFVDSLWSARGGFVGSWEDDALDCEYTYYGLLALGHLSL